MSQGRTPNNVPECRFASVTFGFGENDADEINGHWLVRSASAPHPRTQHDVALGNWLSRPDWLPDEEGTGVNESSIQASHIRASSLRRWGFFFDLLGIASLLRSSTPPGAFSRFSDVSPISGQDQ